MTSVKPVVAIYRDSWLPMSEGFVLEQAQFFRRYDVVGLGLTRLAEAHESVDQLPLHLVPGTSEDFPLGRLRTHGFKPGTWAATVRREISVVHAHFAPDACIARHIARELNVPLIVSTHGYDITQHDLRFARDPAGRSYLRARRHVKRDASLLLPVSEFLHGEMIRKGWPAHKTATHYLGVDLCYWRPPETPPAVESADFAFVGRLIPLKGADVAIRAIAGLRDSVPNARLHVVGEGRQRRDLEVLAHRLGAQVIFHGAQPRAAVRQIFHGCRAAVVTSKTVEGRREALSLVALEAAATGLPVVASRSGGLSEAVSDGQTGFLVPEDDAAAVTDHLRRIWSEPTLAEHLGANGRAMVTDRFSIVSQARVLEDHYDRAIAGHGALTSRKATM